MVSVLMRGVRFTPAWPGRRADHGGLLRPMAGMPAVGCLREAAADSPKTHNLAQQVSFRIDADIGGEHLAEVALQVLGAPRRIRGFRWCAANAQRHRTP